MRKLNSVRQIEQFFVGRGAGAHPTASAVLSDISALTYDYRYEYKKISRAQDISLTENLDLNVFLRHEKQDAENVKSHVKSVSESYLNGESGYVTGRISFENLKKIHTDDTLKKSFVLLDVAS